MKDTEPGGKLYDEALQRGADVARKVNDADGPLHLDADEAATLKVLLLGFQKEAEIAQEANRSIGEAIYPRSVTGCVAARMALTWRPYPTRRRQSTEGHGCDHHRGDSRS